MDSGESCDECESQNLSKDESRGEVVCDDCGVVFEDELVDSSPTRKEGEDTRSGGPTYRKGTKIRLDQKPRAGDNPLTIPRAEKNKARQRAKKQKIEDILSEIERLGNEKLQLEREFHGLAETKSEMADQVQERIFEISDEIIILRAEAIKLGRKGAPTGDWMFNPRAKRWLGLRDREEEPDIDPEFKKLTDKTWINTKLSGKKTIGYLTDLLSKTGVPERAPVDQNGKALVTPTHERIGLEVFTHLTGEMGAFWFFDDFVNRSAMHPPRIGLILEEGHLVSFGLQYHLLNIAKRGWSDAGSISRFVERCAKLTDCRDALGAEKIGSTSRIPLPDGELWGKLGLGPRGSNSVSTMRYWVQRESAAREMEREDGRLIDPNLIRGFARKHPNPLILRHIPLAYYVAQEFRSRGVDRRYCVMILDLIADDLEWCPATVEEMDEWWDSEWGRISDRRGVSSVTELRVTRDSSPSAPRTH